MALDFDQPVGFYLDLLGGVALVGLAVLVALVRPRRALNLAFAGYAFSAGVGFVVAHVFFLLDDFERGGVAFGIGIGLAGAALIVVGVLIDRTMADRRRAVWPFGVAVVIPYIVDRVLAHILFGLGGPALDLVWFELLEFLYALAFAGVFFMLLLAAVRTRQSAWTMPPAVTAFLVVGLVALPAFDVASSIALYGHEADWRSILLVGLRLCMFLVCGVVWLAAVPQRGRPALVACLACFFFPALGILTGLVPEGTALYDFLFQGSFGAVAFIGVACLAYAILRHQMFDMDIRLKLTLKRSTVAAIFLGAFFVAAQLAQNFLSDALGWGVGGVAAGLLLFTLNPIQRAAERLSDKALPGVRPEDPSYVLRRKRETYRNAYATAWGDGNLTQKDMRMLHQVREALGLPEKDILAIEREWTAKST